MAIVGVRKGWQKPPAKPAKFWRSLSANSANALAFLSKSLILCVFAFNYYVRKLYIGKTGLGE
jgi:hypothetical protein